MSVLSIKHHRQPVCHHRGSSEVGGSVKAPSSFGHCVAETFAVTLSFGERESLQQSGGIFLNVALNTPQTADNCGTPGQEVVVHRIDGGLSVSLQFLVLAESIDA